MFRSYALLSFCVVIWGSNYVFSSMLLEMFSPLGLSFLRLLSTVIFLVIYAYFAKQLVPIPKRLWKYFIPLALLSVLINQVTYFIGLKTTGATTAALIQSLAPIFSILFAAIFLGEKAKKQMYFGSVIAFVGVYLVIGDGAAQFKLTLGVVLVFISMISFAGGMIIVRKLSDTMTSFSTTVYNNLIGMLMLMPIAMGTGSFSGPFTTKWWAWALLVGSALLAQGVCGLIWNKELKNIGVGKASIFLNIQPFVTMIVGYLLMGTAVTVIQVLGSMLIIGGVVLTTLEWNRRKGIGTKAVMGSWTRRGRGSGM